MSNGIALACQMARTTASSHDFIVLDLRTFTLMIRPFGIVRTSTSARGFSKGGILFGNTILLRIARLTSSAYVMGDVVLSLVLALAATGAGDGGKDWGS